jgi:NAD(P)-dependent dehydrogenase (short-subunit alcohol dehydrogenase family)
MQTLNGKVAIVTGGSRGIGLAIAHALVAEGVNVTVTGRSEAHLSAARPRIEGAGHGAVETLQADVRRFDDMRRVVDATVARFGGLDMLINNAGVGVFAGVAAMTPEQWSEVIDTNLTGVFNACHAAIPHLRRRGGGYIVNISSLAGKNPFKGAAAYCASKAGLNAFSEVLMQEVRYDNIRVSYVMPGSVATEFSGGDPSKGADWKVSAEIETMTPRVLRVYAEICAWTLARAHARSGDRVAIAAYLGKNDAFAQAIADFSVAYAHQNERDYAALAEAVKSGRITAKTGV